MKTVLKLVFFEHELVHACVVLADELVSVVHIVQPLALLRLTFRSEPALDFGVFRR